MTGGRRRVGVGENVFKCTERKQSLCRRWRFIVGMCSRCEDDLTNVDKSQSSDVRVLRLYRKCFIFPGQGLMNEPELVECFHHFLKLASCFFQVYTEKGARLTKN